MYVYFKPACGFFSINYVLKNGDYIPFSLCLYILLFLKLFKICCLAGFFSWILFYFGYFFIFTKFGIFVLWQHGLLQLHFTLFVSLPLVLHNISFYFWQLLCLQKKYSSLSVIPQISNRNTAKLPKTPHYWKSLITTYLNGRSYVCIQYLCNS